jgi:hypothetical protein
MRFTGAFHLLEFEFIGPDNYGPPDQLIQQHDDGDHGRKAPQDGARIAMAGGRLQKGAQAGQTKVPRTEHEHFASHQKKPSAGNGHHGVPNEANGGKGQVELDKALPSAEAVDDGGFAQFARLGFERGVKAEGDVPDLPGEDQQDGAQLNANLAVRKNSHHGQHHTGQKTEHWDGLQNIQQGNHDDFGAARLCGDITVRQSEEQAEQIRDGDTHEGVEGVQRKDSWILRDLRLRGNGTEPGTADGVYTVDGGKNKKKNRDVDEESEIPPRAGGPPLRGRNGRRGLRGAGGKGQGKLKPR